MSLRRSHRLTWTTSRASRGIGIPLMSRPVCRRVDPGVPSLRTNATSRGPALPSIRPARPRVAATTSSVSGAFLTLKGSIDGVMTLQLLGRDPLRGVHTPGEDERVGVLDQRSQEGPALVGQRRGGVATDVAPPDHLRAGVAELRHHSRGLRIVQHDDVAWTHHRHQVVDVRAQRLGEKGMLGVAQGAAVTRLPVQHVVHPLGDDEEVRGTRQHPPSGVDADPACVRKHGLQHLRHATAMSGGVDVPDDLAVEELTRLRRHGVEQVVALVGQQRGEAVRCRAGRC